MKAKSITKRVLSAVLCTVMLFSCWVFTAPSASAAYTGVSAGTYNVKITCESGKETGGWNSDHHWTFYGKGTNGTASEASLGTLDQKVNYESTKTVYENTSCSSFPSKITYKYSFGGGILTWREVKITLHVYVNGTEVLSEYKSDSSSPLSSASGTFTWTVDSSKYPKASTMSGLSVTGGTVSADDNTFAVSGPTAVKDQYGVVIASAKTSESFSVANYKATNSSGANLTQDIAVSSTAVSKKDDNGFKAQGYQNHYLQIKCTSSFNGGTATGYADCTLTYKALTATWKYYTNNSNGASGTENTATSTVYFGDTPAARTDLTKAYYDNAKHHSGGTFSTSRMTANKTFTMSYSSNVSHTMNQYSQIANDKTNHTVKCSGCAYQKTEAHGSSYSGFTDNGDGNCSRTCSKCQFVQTEAHDWGDWQIIPETDTANAFAGHDRMAQHYRVCKNCQTAKDYDNHNWVAGEAVAPTCTDDGYTPYTCSDCKQETKNLNGEHVDRLGHNFQYDPTGTPTDTQHREACSRCDATQMVNHSNYGDWYEVDGTTHAHDCGICGKAVTATHSSWSGWQHAAPTAEEAGVRAIVRETLATASYNAAEQCFNYCTDCGSVQYQNHKWGDAEVTEAGCTTKGSKKYTCADCENIKTEELPVRGHDDALKLIKAEPKDGITIGDAYVCYLCTRCNHYFVATYSENNTYVAQTTDDKGEPITGAQDAASVKSSSDKVPSPYFNNYSADVKKDGYSCPYNERPCSLKLMKEPYSGLDTYQEFRFSGSVSIPNDYDKEGDEISYQIDPTKDAAEVDNVITDFGFIYTQDSYGGEYGADKLTLENVKADNHYAKMSVVKNNEKSGTFTGDNWKGVTFHEGEEGSATNPDTLTFNLVIKIKAKNWKMQYAARPYITYKYHGQEYTVYDSGASDISGSNLNYSFGSVYAFAVNIITTGVKDDVQNPYYVSKPVWDYIIDRIATHHDDIGRDDATDEQGNPKYDWWQYYYCDTFEDYYGFDKDNYDYFLTCPAYEE